MKVIQWRMLGHGWTKRIGIFHLCTKKIKSTEFVFFFWCCSGWKVGSLLSKVLYFLWRRITAWNLIIIATFFFFFSVSPPFFDYFVRFHVVLFICLPMFSFRFDFPLDSYFAVATQHFSPVRVQCCPLKMADAGKPITAHWKLKYHGKLQFSCAIELSVLLFIFIYPNTQHSKVAKMKGRENMDTNGMLEFKSSNSKQSLYVQFTGFTFNSMCRDAMDQAAIEKRKKTPYSTFTLEWVSFEWFFHLELYTVALVIVYRHLVCIRGTLAWYVVLSSPERSDSKHINKLQFENHSRAYKSYLFGFHLRGGGHYHFSIDLNWSILWRMFDGGMVDFVNDNRHVPLLCWPISRWTGIMKTD